MHEGHKCRRMHGHTYKVQVEVGGELRNGMLPDYESIGVIVKAVTDRLDHRVLNEIGGLENPTTELLAVWLAERIGPAIDACGGVLVALVVDEGGHECVWRRDPEQDATELHRQVTFPLLFSKVPPQ
jgi:queuosine biosynthesis protein QueD